MYDTKSVEQITEYITCAQRRGAKFVGLAGSQGSGKSTLSMELKSKMIDMGINCVVLCLDDFYYTKSERETLAREVHPLFSTRGVPGTHDIESLNGVAIAILSNEPISWPKFSKALDDRTCNDKHHFIPKPGTQPLVILEGWCVGCVPSPLDGPMNELEAREDSDSVWRRYINEQIETRYLPLWEMLDFYIYIQIPGWEFVTKWRGTQSKSNEESLINLERFIQFFERITRNMMSPQGRIPTNLVVAMGPDHSIIDISLQ
jgi:D-glycerate 3-kinase